MNNNTYDLKHKEYLKSNYSGFKIEGEKSKLPHFLSTKQRDFNNIKPNIQTKRFEGYPNHPEIIVNLNIYYII